MDDEPFLGFASPTYTTVPDEVFDLLLPRLSEAELKVLLYIIRRTFGWKKRADDISFSQLQHGIQRHDGSALDRGTGMSKNGVARGLKGLLDKGVIVAQRNDSRERGHEPTTYALRFRDAPLVPGEDKLTPQRGPALVPQGDTQETVLQEEGEPTWERVKEQLRPQMSRANYATWLDGTRAVGREGATLVVAVATRDVARELGGRYARLVARALGEVAPGIGVRYVVE